MTEELNEKLPLAYHRKLNQKIFDGDVIRPEVRVKLLDIAHAWAQFSKIQETMIEDIIFTGGNCNYNYTRQSDIDVHLVVDKYSLFPAPEFVDEYLSTKKTIWALSRHIRVKGFPVEMYAQDKKDKLVASGVYSLKNDRWLSKPRHGKYNFTTDPALESKVKELADTIQTMIVNKLPEAKFRIMKDKLKNLRKDALAGGDEFSFDNLVFKALRNEGVLDDMNKYLKGLLDKELSL